MPCIRVFAPGTSKRKIGKLGDPTGHGDLTSEVGQNCFRVVLTLASCTRA